MMTILSKAINAITQELSSDWEKQILQQIKMQNAASMTS